MSRLETGAAAAGPIFWKDLQEDGEAVSETRVARLMREEGILPLQTQTGN